MRHFDEKTIELYVLGSDLVVEQMDEIELHFKECCGCRELADEIRSFYQDLQENLGQLSLPDRHKNNALLRLPGGLMELGVHFSPRVPFKSMTAMGSFLYFVYRHPVPSAVGGFALLLAMAFGVNYAMNDFMKDKNPAYSHLNADDAVIEIYNKDNQFLWGIPSKSVYMVPERDYSMRSKKVMVVDIDGDKNNEIITTLFTGENIGLTPPLTCFSSSGKKISENIFNEKVQFRDVQYDDRFGAYDLLCTEGPVAGEKEIFTTADNGRSPIFVNRLSNRGEILGQYFHFGNGSIAAINLGGKKAIAFFGQNDADEPDSLSFGVLSVLDPSKIEGKSEASDSRGFGFRASDAEMIVIRFPLTDMNYLMTSPGHAASVKETTMKGEGTINVTVRGNSNELPIFDYIFSDQMKILEVKFNSATLKLREQFIENGQITGTFDQEYLDRLKDGIRYWNGAGWQAGWTMVSYGS